MKAGLGDIRIKTIPEDFLVQESKSMFTWLENQPGGYSLLVLGKKGYSTFEAINIIASDFNINVNMVGYAGLKDEDAVTYQYITIPSNIDINDKIIKFNKNYRTNEKFILLKHHGYLKSAIKIGQLQGNAFRIVLRNVPKNVANLIQKLKKKRVIFPNYYDTQRFGIPNMPKKTHLIGKALYEKKYDLAMKYMKEGVPLDWIEISKYMSKDNFFEKINRSKLSFYYNAYTSKMFNNYLQYHISKKIDYKEKCYDGITYAMPQNGKSLLCLDGELEKICVPRYEPIANGETSLKYFYRYSYIDTIMNVNKFEKDSLFAGKYSVSVDFLLQSGCYATMAIKQFLCDVENQIHKLDEDY